MQFNVAQLLQEPIGSTRRYDLIEEISQLDPELEALGPLVGQIQMLRTNSGVLVTGELSTALRVTCNRCLAPIAQEVRFQLEENFHTLTEVHTGRAIDPQEFEGTLAELEDDALLIDSHHILDLSEVIRQDLWLASPMAPGCNWDGEGQCPNLTRYLTELENLERASGQPADDEPPVDPRWAALLQLQTDDPEDD
ncbi:MAG: DUF177 domain-containing protein [Caldilineaceae bacterium]|nr:DUF177 domain-containing protein [Caldilineaceae bacterium]MCB9138531.1 DUF177 domain-containing protein [Caldilineaceae bacterium]